MAIDSRIAPHTPVAVRCRFDGSWVEGFEIADVEADRSAPYVLRRVYDGTELPGRFGPEDLRASPLVISESSR